MRQQPVDQRTDIGIGEFEGEVISWLDEVYPDRDKIWGSVGLSHTIGQLGITMLRRDTFGREPKADALLMKYIGGAMIHLCNIAEDLDIPMNQAAVIALDSMRADKELADKKKERENANS